VRLEHTPGVLPDLLLFRLTADPGLTALPIASTPPPLSTEAHRHHGRLGRGAAFVGGSLAGILVTRWSYGFRRALFTPDRL